MDKVCSMHESEKKCIYDFKVKKPGMKVAGSCEHYSELPGSMKGKKRLGITGFLDCSHSLLF
jgi:hypothetical protein